METTISKQVYAVTFRHTNSKDDDKTIMNVVAGDFTEAVKKAQDNKQIVMSGKEDQVEIFCIEVALIIDVE